MNIHDYYITIYVSSEPVFNLRIVFLHRLYLMPTVSGEYLALILNFCCYLILRGNPSDIFACSPCLHVGSYIILLLQLSISLSKTAVHPHSPVSSTVNGRVHCLAQWCRAIPIKPLPQTVSCFSCSWAPPSQQTLFRDPRLTNNRSTNQKPPF